MARVTISATLGQSLNEGYNSSAARAANPDASVAAAQALVQPITDAITAIAALSGFSILSGAATSITAANAAVTALNSALTTAKSSTSSGDLVLDFNNATITTRNQLQAAVAAAIRNLGGSDTLTS